MPCTGLSLSFPGISCLNFDVLWDISGAQPVVTITNTSTVASYANLKWWFYVISPSGVSIHGEDLDALAPADYPTADVANVSWATKTYNLSTPFGNPPCGQVEFSPTNPYNVVVFVQDSTSTPVIDSYNKTATIVRPKGNSMNTCGNFGAAIVSMKVDCGAKIIMCRDSTNLTYNGIITPIASPTNTWTLVYPQDPSGAIPNRTATNTPNVNFPISINSKGYTLYLQEYATYDLGNGVTIKIQYKAYTKGGDPGLVFAVNCNTNLCLLQCQMQKFYNLSKAKCGNLVDAELNNLMTRLNWLFAQILTGIFQPLCGIDVPALMDEMKRVGNFDDNCDCNCSDGGALGFSNPTGGNSPSACCPTFTSVIDIDTDDPPVNCPNGYYPADVYDPTAEVIIGIAYSAADVVNIINANAAWQAYGTAFVAGNCQVGFFPLSGGGGVVIPDPRVNPHGGGSGGGNYIIDVVDVVGDPVTCLASYFPAQVYNPDGTIIIGVAYDVVGMVSIMNANAGWQAYGTAYVVDNCHVGIMPLPEGPGNPPPVVVNPPPADPGCVDGRQTYPITTTDLCNNTIPITSANFPLNLYVNFGLGAGDEFVGNVADQAAMIIALNAFASKPVSVTFSAGPTVDQVIADNSDCGAYSGTITIRGNGVSASYLLFGANHSTISQNISQQNAEQALSVQTLSVLGGISDPAVRALWHNIKIGNVLIATDPQHGQVLFWDISNPLMPTIARIIQLNTVVVANFSGVPESATLATDTDSPPYDIKTWFDLYFPTDYYASMSLGAVYVVESLTGTIWKLDYNGAGTGILASFQDDKLIGKCPRVLLNGKLYFTQDGNLEQATGQSSGITAGDIVVLDTSDFTSSGLDTETIVTSQTERVWAASYDGVNTIWFTGQKTTIAPYDVSTESVTANHIQQFGGMLYRGNTTFHQGKLYILPQHMNGYQGVIFSVSALPNPAYTEFDTPPSGAIDGLFNFLPLANCMGLLTSAKIDSSGSPAHVALYKLDGTFLSEIVLGEGIEIFNVIAIPNITTTTPNNFV